MSTCTPRPQLTGAGQVGLKVHGRVELAALGAARAVGVMVVGVNQPAFGAAEDAVLRVRGAEAAALEFGKNAHPAQPAERYGHID